MHLEYSFSGTIAGTMVQDVTHTPNSSFEGQSASEWATTVTLTYPAFGTFVTNSKSYSRVEGNELVTLGGTGELTAPFPGTLKTVNNPPYRDKRYTLSLGQSITQTYSSTTTTTLTGMEPSTTTSSITTTTTYHGQESITVPAGTYNTCKFETSTAGVGTGSFTWEIIGKGVVARSVSPDSTGGNNTLALTSGTINGSPIAP